MKLTIVPLQKIDGQDQSKPKHLPPSDPIPSPDPIPTVDDDDDYSYLSSEENDKTDALKQPQNDKKADVTVDLIDNRLEAFTVHVENHRILTLFTYHSDISAKWVKEVLRSYRRDRRIVVGVAVDRQIRYDKKGVKTSINQMMQLCVGSQCLIVELPASYDYPDVELPLIPFFDHPRVFAAGMDMKNMGERLFEDHKIKFRNVVDLNEMAEEVLEDSHHLDLKRYDLDKLGKTVMGRSWFVDRPVKIKWYELNQFWGQLTLDKLMFATYDAYLCFSIGSKLLEIKREKEGGAAGNKKGVRKKN